MPPQPAPSHRRKEKMSNPPADPTPRRGTRVRVPKPDDDYIYTPYKKRERSHSTSASRGPRAHSIVSDNNATSPAPDVRAAPVPKAVVKLPEHYTLPPTVPPPFSGDLEISLDAILAWGQAYADTQRVVDTLLRVVDRRTDWQILLGGMMGAGNRPAGRGRYLVEECLFLVTRTLLPEQVLENRLAMARLYERKKQLAIRLTLRYDMLREWKMIDQTHPVTVQSVPPPTAEPGTAHAGVLGIMTGSRATAFPHRRSLMQNIIPTLIAAPPGGWSTIGVRERMRHHVTELDDYLMLTDEQVSAWSDERLIKMTSQIILQWQWLRENNEVLLEMEVHGWEELDGRAEECEWIVDDVKKMSLVKREKGEKGGNANGAESEVKEV